MRVCLPPWVSLEIAGGIQEVLQQEEGEGDPQGGRGSGGGGLWGTGGHAQLLPESVPATALRFRPGDSTSYLVGTVAGHLLLVRVCVSEFVICICLCVYVCARISDICDCFMCMCVCVCPVACLSVCLDECIHVCVCVLICLFSGFRTGISALSYCRTFLSNYQLGKVLYFP